MRQLRVKKFWVYVWSAVEVDSGDLLALEPSYGRGCLNAIAFIKKALKLCSSKPIVKLIGVHGMGGLWIGLDWNTSMRGSV